ncbi:hypothetical protein CHISP_1665 [Chitinispirillum alkaliphilum]|nr:hypothetical protein CHISP_1665 [Chitinispirillum alkaliphilum]
MKSEKLLSPFGDMVYLSFFAIRIGISLSRNSTISGMLAPGESEVVFRSASCMG